MRTLKMLPSIMTARNIVMYAARGTLFVAGQNCKTDTAAVISAGMIITHYLCISLPFLWGSVLEC